jgi:hypothetical protein
MVAHSLMNLKPVPFVENLLFIKLVFSLENILLLSSLRAASFLSAANHRYLQICKSIILGLTIAMSLFKRKLRAFL